MEGSILHSIIDLPNRSNYSTIGLSQTEVRKMIELRYRLVRETAEAIVPGPSVWTRCLWLLLSLFGVLPAPAQDPSTPLSRYEFSAGYSVNADFVVSRPVLVVVDQKVSPFFGHGSGPTGFELSLKRYVWKGLGIKSDLSMYSDVFPPGRATYCQSSGCVSGLTFRAKGRAFYLTAGPEWKIWRDKRVAPFAHALGGIVHDRSTFVMTGSPVGQAFMGGLILYSSSGFPTDRNIAYSDSNAAKGFAVAFGGGFDIRLTKKSSFRVSSDYNPTFLVRPVVHDPIVDAQGRVVLSQPSPSERQRQDHARVTVGIVWSFR